MVNLEQSGYVTNIRNRNLFSVYSLKVGCEF